VRSLLVPALATMLGERVWWPSHPGRLDDRAEGTKPS